SSGMIKVRSVTLDGLVKRHRLDRLDVVKLDVEGAEFRALEAGLTTIRRTKPLVVLEVLEPALIGQGTSPTELFGLFTREGYRLFKIPERSGRPVPLSPGVDRANNVMAVHPARDFGLLE